MSAFQSLKRLHRDFYDIFELLIFLQRLQKNLRGCNCVVELKITLQTPECFQRLLGNVLEVLFLKNDGGV